MDLRYHEGGPDNLPQSLAGVPPAALRTDHTHRFVPSVVQG